MTSALLRTVGGGALAPASGCWLDEADPIERRLLVDLARPVLDVGCGPGRHVVALAEAGVPALGIDVTPHAVARARARGAVVLHRSIFDRVPGAGRWGSALLLDGNIGIGGEPARIVARVASLLRSGGQLLVETGPPGSGDRVVREVCLEMAGARGPWFAWASVGADELEGVAEATGIRLVTTYRAAERWFGLLETP